MIICGLFNMMITPQFYGMTKMPKMQKIPNLFLLVGRDHQFIYFTMLSPPMFLKVVVALSLVV